MDLRMLALLSGLGVVAVAMIATAIETRDDDELRVRPATAGNPVRDPLAEELARCKALGPAAAGDAVCEQTWTELRRRFFAPADPATRSTPTNLFPTSPEIQPQPQPASRKDQSRLENGRPPLSSRSGDAENSGEPGE